MKINDSVIFFYNLDFLLHSGIVSGDCAFKRRKYAYHIKAVDYSNDSAVFTVVATMFSIGSETNEKAI